EFPLLRLVTFFGWIIPNIVDGAEDVSIIVEEDFPTRFLRPDGGDFFFSQFREWMKSIFDQLRRCSRFEMPDDPLEATVFLRAYDAMHVVWHDRECVRMVTRFVHGTGEPRRDG